MVGPNGAGKTTLFKMLLVDEELEGGSIEWKRGASSPTRIIDRLDEIGFRAHPFSPRKLDSEEAREERRLLRYLGVAAFSSMNIMLLSVSVWSGNFSDITPETRDCTMRWMTMPQCGASVAPAGNAAFASARSVQRPLQASFT